MQRKEMGVTQFMFRVILKASVWACVCVHTYQIDEIDIVINPHFPDEVVEGHRLYCCGQCSLYVELYFWKLPCGSKSCKMGGI